MSRKQEIAKISREIKEIKAQLETVSGSWEDKPWWEILKAGMKKGKSTVSPEEKAYAQEIAKYIEKSSKRFRDSLGTAGKNFWGIDNGSTPGGYRPFKGGLWWNSESGIQGFGYFTKEGENRPWFLSFKGGPYTNPHNYKHDIDRASKWLEKKFWTGAAIYVEKD